MESQNHEELLHRLGLRNADSLAERWANHGIPPQEMVDWIAAGVPVDEPHIAAALAAAEWTPAQASRSISATENLTLIDAVRQHPSAASFAREFRGMVG